MSTWYVRPIAGTYTPADGTSYATAYDGFAGIDWTDFSPGDTLYICGTHNEQCTVATIDGTSDAYFYIDGGYEDDPGSIVNTGTVRYGIHSPARDYIYIKNLAVADMDNGSGSGVGIYLTNNNFSVIDNCTATGTASVGLQLDYCQDSKIINSSATENTLKGYGISGDVLGPSERCYIENCIGHSNTSDNFVISGLAGTQNTIDCGLINCTSYSSGRYGYQIDLCGGSYMINCTSTTEVNSNVYHKDAVNTSIQGCTFTGNDAADMVQVIGHTGLTCGNMRIWGNTFKDLTFNGYAIETIDLFVPGMSICGNIFDSCRRGVRALNNIEQEFCNNVCIDTQECYRAQTAVTSSNAVLSNNIFTHSGLTVNGFIFSSVTGNDFIIDNNHYYAPSNVDNAFIRINGISYKVSDYTTLDTNGTDGDPELGSDYKLPIGSTLSSSGIKAWTGPNPQGRDGEPFSDWDTSQGAFQATDATNNPFHPLNL